MLEARLMKVWLLSVLLLLVSVTLVAAQGERRKDGKNHPDLTGTWVLDKSKSDFGPFQSSPVVKADVTLVISHREPELKITRRASLNGRSETQELAYYTDERGEKNPSVFGKVGLESKTKWEGTRLVARSVVMRRSASGEPIRIESVERWQLSSDGRTLTQGISINAPFGTQSIKQVYNRQP